MQEATFFKVWQNRFLYLGVVIGNLGDWLSRFLIRFLISVKEIYELITRKISKPRFETVWSLNMQYLFTIVLGISL